ncbi:hypothetical protein K438DRAFT_1965046 [Mycena galopus ATCC 62051]|nr:hypothetical protein K438DRAFT_1965046 [Mycena galopus ATCC 62051]
MKDATKYIAHTHGQDSTGPATEQLGWCGVHDHLDFVDGPANDVVASNGVLRGAFQPVPESVDVLWDPYTIITYGFINPDDAIPYRRERVPNALTLYEMNTSLTLQLVLDITGMDFNETEFGSCRETMSWSDIAGRISLISYAAFVFCSENDLRDPPDVLDSLLPRNTAIQSEHVTWQPIVDLPTYLVAAANFLRPNIALSDK